MLINLDKTQCLSLFFICKKACFLYIAKKKVQDSIEIDDWQTDDRETHKHVLLIVLAQVFFISKSTFKLLNSKCLCKMVIELIIIRMISTILKFWTVETFSAHDAVNFKLIF